MARKEKNTVDYFPFDCDEGKKSFYIDSKYKNDGYATWVKILRQLAVTENHYLDLSDEMALMFFSSKCHIDEALLKEILNDLAKLEAIDKQLWNDYNIVWSQKFVDDISDAYKKRKNKICTKQDILLLKGAEIQQELKSERKAEEEMEFPLLGVVGNTQRKEKNTIEKETIEKERKKVPPLLPEETDSFPLKKAFDTWCAANNIACVPSNLSNQTSIIRQLRERKKENESEEDLWLRWLSCWYKRDQFFQKASFNNLRAIDRNFDSLMVESNVSINRNRYADVKSVL